MDNSLLFVNARAEEYIIALDMYIQTAMSLKAKGIDHWTIWLEPDEARILKLKDDFSKSEYYFVYEKEERVGMFRLITRDPYFWGSMDEEGWYVHALVTDIRHTGKQIGRRTLGQLIRSAKEKKIPFIRLDCNANNAFLPAYYESIGFLYKGQKQIPQSLNNLYELRF